jgi:arylformamidase
VKIYDVSVSISNNLPIYPGDPEIKITRTHSLEKGDIARVSHLSFNTHIGTHIDPPAHFVMDGKTLDHIPLDLLIGPARVIDVGDVDSIGPENLERTDLDSVTRLIFKTRNSRFWRESNEFRKDFVYLEPEGAELLVKLGIKLVGIDYLSIEKFNFDKPATHWTLLGNNIIIVEGLDLSEVPPGDYELICLPLKIKDGDGGPARVVLRELQARTSEG